MLRQLSDSPKNITIFLFGPTGSGKNFVGSTLENDYGFQLLDGDDCLSPDMMEIIKTGGVISQQMRDDFILNIIDATKLLQQLYSRVVVCQAFIKDANRQQIIREIPESKWFYIDTDIELRYSRLANRINHFADSQYARTMDSNYESPTIDYQIINNNVDRLGVKKQIEKLLQISENVHANQKYLRLSHQMYQSSIHN